MDGRDGIMGIGCKSQKPLEDERLNFCKRMQMVVRRESLL